MINKERLLKKAVIATILFMVVAGTLQVVFPIRPFWVDEWRVIYNLKFKSSAALWGPLDFMQQFPRVYLQVMKACSAAFGYSYTSLRLPSFLVSCCSILLGLRLGQRLFVKSATHALLFVVFILSSYTFTEFFVQIKQYSMDVLLSLVALWQLMALLRLRRGQKLEVRRYALLCLTFATLPFFSYTYPITLAPVYAVILWQWLAARKDSPAMMLQLLPLCVGLISIGAFYYSDVRLLIADKGMSSYWQANMFSATEGWQATLAKVYALFAQAGPGAFFGNVIGLLGTVAFLRGIYFSTKTARQRAPTLAVWLRQYSIILLLLTLLLFFAGKLPLAEPRLNAFTVPAIAILIIDLLNSARGWLLRPAAAAIALLYIGLLGNIYTTSVAFFAEEKYARKMEIYRATQQAILLAHAHGCPILVTPGIAYPYEGTPDYPLMTPLRGDWILKTFPAYKVADAIAIYPLTALDSTQAAMMGLPAGIGEAVVGDGRHYGLIHRH